jgi:hypothetical protein
MSSLKGGSHRPGESSAKHARAEEADDSADDDPVVSHARQGETLNTDQQGTLGEGLATPWVAEEICARVIKLIPVA